MQRPRIKPCTNIILYVNLAKKRKKMISRNFSKNSDILSNLRKIDIMLEQTTTPRPMMRTRIIALSIRFHCCLASNSKIKASKIFSLSVMTSTLLSKASSFSSIVFNLFLRIRKSWVWPMINPEVNLKKKNRCLKDILPFQRKGTVMCIRIYVHQNSNNNFNNLHKNPSNGHQLGKLSCKSSKLNIQISKSSKTIHSPGNGTDVPDENQ